MQGWIAKITLLLIAVCAGIAWRAELEYRSGWAGLAWVGYFHWAVPAGILAFLVWSVCVAKARRPEGFALTLLVFAVIAYVAVEWGFSLCFVSGPSMFVAGLLSEEGLEASMQRLVIMQRIVPLLWPLLPLAFCGICRAFGIPITLKAALCSAVLFCLSWPMAVFVRGFFEDRGSPDLIHALKSGAVIPFLVISLGLPLLCCRRARRPELPRSEEAVLHTQ